MANPVFKRFSAYAHDTLRVALLHVPMLSAFTLLFIILAEHAALIAALWILYGCSSSILSWLYFAYAESSSRQATKGKLLEGFIVVDEAGRRISFPRATIRHVLFLLCGLTLGLAFIPGLFSKEGRFPHDYLSRTRVIPGAPAARDLSPR